MKRNPVPPDLDWLHALREPERVQVWSLDEWQHVIRLSRRLRLLGRLAERVGATGLEEQLPDPVQRHLLAERRRSRWRLTVLNWTVDQVGQMLATAEHPLVLLKGAAYVAQGLPIAAGRLPSDLDILVPRAAIAAVQQRLKDCEWREVPLDAHDQRYYREWSHEVPPMHHPRLGIELDLHHNILPPVARTNVDAKRLLDRLQPCGSPPWQVLCPADQVLHSAAHLFLDSELRDRVRDLVDLDGLMRHFAASDGDFWPGLAQRASELGLVEPLALALHFVISWLGTPVPGSVVEELARQGPSAMRKAWLLPLFEAVLRPTGPDRRPAARQNLAATVLLARYHRQRLPLHLLLPHLWRKALRRSRSRHEGDDRA